jgi:hypothetical protein
METAADELKKSRVKSPHWVKFKTQQEPANMRMPKVEVEEQE